VPRIVALYKFTYLLACLLPIHSFRHICCRMYLCEQRHRQTEGHTADRR